MENEGESLLRRIRSDHLDAVEKSGLGLLFAYSDQQDVRLYKVQTDGIPMRIDEDPSYGCLGRGYASGGAVLLQQFLRDDLTTFRAARLAAYVIMAVHEVDNTVGDVPEIFQTTGGRARRFKDPAEEIVRNRIRARAGSLSDFWRLLDSNDATFEAKASVALQRPKFRAEVERLVNRQKLPLKKLRRPPLTWPAQIKNEVEYLRTCLRCM